MNWKPDFRSCCSSLALFFLLGVVACERPMTIAVTKDSNPPSFRLSGSGRLVFLAVSEVLPNKTPSLDDPVLWKIKPTEENLISSLPKITYSVVPPGFTQTAPTNGTPQPLLEGRLV